MVGNRQSIPSSLIGVLWRMRVMRFPPVGAPAALQRDSARSLQPRLKEPPGLLKLTAPGGRQALAGAVDEELDHANARGDPFGAHALAGHAAGNGLCALGK